jgi:hypothetical protein
MQIVVRRTGGYAGGGQVSSVDTARLDAERRNRIEQLVRDASASVEREEPVGADLMRYEITVQENGTTRSLAWTDDGRPGPVRELINELGQLS